MTYSMKLFEILLRDSVFVDFGVDPHYSEDEVQDEEYGDGIFRFAVVEFELMPTDMLCKIADRLRKDKGFKPLRPMDEYTVENCDHDGMYRFYTGFNDWNNGKFDSRIRFAVYGSDSPDNGKIYNIQMTEEEAVATHDWLNQQFKKYLGKWSEDLLEEARRRMEDDS